MSSRSFDAAAEMFAAAYAQALKEGDGLTAEEVVELARRRAGETAAPEALAAAAQVAAEINDAATILAEETRTAAAAQALSAIQDWADIEHATDVLATQLEAAMVTPDMTTVDRRAAGARAGDMAAAMSRTASAAAAKTAFERAIVSRAVAKAAARIVAGVEADARDVVIEIARTAARVRETAEIAAALLGDRPPDDDSVH